MIEKIKKKTTVIEEDMVSITCDRCGKVDVVPYFSDIQSHSISFGYGSKRDTEVHHMEICDDCYDEIIADFKTPPRIDEN